MPVRIDKRFNLVVPIYEDNEDSSPIVAYVHSVPLSEAVVDRWFMVLGKTYSAIFQEGFAIASGPAHAARILRHIATTNGWWDDRHTAEGRIPGVENGLMAEIRRLTNVLAPLDGKWTSLPWDVAIQQNVLSDGDAREVENAIVFFIAACATLNRAQRETLVRSATDIWGAQLTLLNSSEFGNSLRTSTATVNSGATPPAIASESAGPANATIDGKPSSIPV